LIPLLNLNCGDLMGSCFWGGNLATESAAKDAGDARMTAMAEEKLAHH
jgi:hypothetical protein